MGRIVCGPPESFREALLPCCTGPDASGPVRERVPDRVRVQGDYTPPAGGRPYGNGNGYAIRDQGTHKNCSHCKRCRRGRPHGNECEFGAITQNRPYAIGYQVFGENPWGGRWGCSCIL